MHWKEIKDESYLTLFSRLKDSGVDGFNKTKHFPWTKEQPCTTTLKMDLLSSLFSLLFSCLLLFRLLFSQRLSLCLSPCGVVVRVVVVGRGVVVGCGVWSVTRWKPRVCRHHAHMCFQHVRVVPAYTVTFWTDTRWREEGGVRECRRQPRVFHWLKTSAFFWHFLSILTGRWGRPLSKIFCLPTHMGYHVTSEIHRKKPLDLANFKFEKTMDKDTMRTTHHTTAYTHM